MVARATDGIVWGELLKQRHGWGVRDCERIGWLARKYLALPDPAIVAWSGEQKYSTGLVKQWREKPDAFADLLKETHATDEDEPDTPASLQAERYAEDLRTDPALRERIIREVEDDNTQRIDRATRLAADPTGVMTLAPPPDADKSRHPMLGLVRAIYSMGAYEGDFLKAGVESRVLLRFMAVHAAIRVFRWENDRLPKTLDELKLPARVTTDPFTAKPLIYEPAATGTDYVLASAGALLPGADGKPDTRTRFVFPPERAPTAAR